MQIWQLQLIFIYICILLCIYYICLLENLMQFDADKNFTFYKK